MQARNKGPAGEMAAKLGPAPPGVYPVPCPPPTFELVHDAAQVALQLGVGGDEQREAVLLRAGEGLGRVDAALVQDAVDAVSCRACAGGDMGGGGQVSR